MRKTADDALVSAAKDGDPVAWRSLYELLGGRVLAWLKAQRLVDASMDADDILNETWMVAARKISEFSGDTDSFAGWLFVIARNAVVNSNRRGSRRATVPIGIDPRHLISPSAVDDEPGLDGRDWTARLLSHLPERERDVVACIDVAGLDIEATSKVLAMSRGAVRVAHHRAMKKLQIFLATDGGEWHIRRRSNGIRGEVSARRI